MVDKTDLAILSLLQRDARMSWKEIGQQVHLTGQAVAGRIQRLQDLGILRRFTVQVDDAKLGRPVLAFVTVFMKTTNHAGFRQFLESQPTVEEAHRISGDGCYWLKVCTESTEALNDLLDQILVHGNYRVNLSTERTK